jgi:hypothetical protein
MYFYIENNNQDVDLTLFEQDKQHCLKLTTVIKDYIKVMLVIVFKG